MKRFFLRQQSNVRWVREGDSNTRFFHTMIQKKRHLFLIHIIRDDSSSEWIYEPSTVADSTVDYFQGLLARDAGSSSRRILTSFSP